MIFIAPITLIVMFAGIAQAIFGIFDEESDVKFEKYRGFILATVVMAMIVFTIFLHLQKRVHKEVFLGYKNQKHQ